MAWVEGFGPYSLINDPRFASQAITVGTEGTIDTPRLGRR